MPAIVAELRTRLLEELDHTQEAMHQKAFHEAYTDPEAARDAVVPGVVLATRRVLVQDWLDGEPLAQVATSGSPTDRDRPVCSTNASCSPGRGAAGGCTPTRIRATSGCCPTGASASSTSAPA